MRKMDDKPWKHQRQRDWYLKNRELSRERAKTWYEQNKERAMELKREWGKNNRVKVSSYRRARVCNLTSGEIEQKMLEHNNRCDICACPPFKRNLHLDHDHKTGDFRGFLCARCNVGLGWVEKLSGDRQLLRQMLGYLKKTAHHS